MVPSPAVVQEPLDRCGLSSHPPTPLPPAKRNPKVSMVVTEPPGRSGLSSRAVSVALEEKPEIALAASLVSMAASPLVSVAPPAPQAALRAPRSAPIAAPARPPPHWPLHPGPGAAHAR